MDVDQVRAWWRRWPDANIGGAAGAVYVVIDVDGDDGLQTLSGLEDLNGWLPAGPASLSGGGGMHLFFKPSSRVRNSVRRLGPGLDTRGQGGAAVLPPSIHPSGGRYAWLPGREPWNLALPEMPGWVLELIDPPHPIVTRTTAVLPANADRYVAAAVERELDSVAHAGSGARNATLFRAAAALSRFIASGDLSAAELGPQLVDAAIAAGLSRQEAEQTALSGLRRAVA